MVKENLDKYDIIMLAYSDIIIKSLQENEIEFFLCYPTKDSKEVYLDRYKKRGNNKEFINNAKVTFEKAVEIAAKRELPSIVLTGNETLEDYLIKNGYKLIKKG